MNTIFGWVILGNVVCASGAVTSNVSCLTTETSLEENMKRFWEVEEPPSIAHSNPNDIIAEESFQRLHYIDANQRFVVPILKRLNTALGFSFNSALKRFYHLERHLTRAPMLQAAYKSFMAEYINLGHISHVAHDRMRQISCVCV